MSVELISGGTVALTNGTPCICADCQGPTRFHLERLRKYPDGRWRLRCFGCQRLANARAWREENQRLLLLQELRRLLRKHLKRQSKQPQRDWLRIPQNSKIPKNPRRAILKREGGYVTLTFWNAKTVTGTERFKSALAARSQAYHWWLAGKKSKCVVELGDLE